MHVIILKNSLQLDTKCVFGFQVCVSKLRFVPFFFFFLFHAFWSIAVTDQWTVTANVDFLQWTVHICTVYGPTNFIFLSNFSLKMGPTSLFTHLKIILLQCFQFSVFSFNKISSIQTHLKLVSYSKSFTHFHYSERFISIFFNLQVGEENLDSWMFW